MLAVELYVDAGEQPHNKALLDALQARAHQLATLGPGISWQRLDNRRASRVATDHEAPSQPPLDENHELASCAVDTVRWNDVVRPVIADLEPATSSPTATTM